jgi:L-threonylcarbamoyladenylate synthase
LASAAAPIRAPDGRTLAAAATALAQGRLVVFPTETVYGLGGDARNDQAVARIFAAKGRPRFNPLIVHVHELPAAQALAGFNPIASILAEAFWPGPLTLVLPRARGAPVSLLASAGLDTLALRVPKHPVARALLEAFGGPLAAPSANPSGRLSPTRAPDVAPLGPDVWAVLDGGDCGVGLESTIVGFGRDGAPEILRPGGIARETLEAVCGPVRPGGAGSERPNAPGQMASHYAPRALLRLNATAPLPAEAFLAFGACEAAAPAPLAYRNLSPSADVTEAAANLFAYLRALDASGAAAIAVAPIPHTGLGEAINDRLLRAAAPREDISAWP